MSDQSTSQPEANPTPAVTAPTPTPTQQSIPYYRPTMVVRPKFEGFIFLLVLVVLAVGVPALYGLNIIDISTVNQLGRFLCIAIVAVGIDLVWGYTGMLSLCQAMFFCLGGYAIGMHMALHGPLDGAQHDIPRALFVVTSDVSGFSLPWFWKPFKLLPIAVFLGLLLPGLLAFVFGFFTFRSRVRGVYFSIITQATTFAAYLVFCLNQIHLCGTNGLTNFVTIAGFDLQAASTQIGLYLATITTLALVYVLSLLLTRSRVGRLMIAVRDNESRLRFTGYQPVAIKLFAFTAGAVLAALGGILYTPQNGIITPFKMSVGESIDLVVLIAVGGRGTLSGAVIGALVISFIKSFLTSNYPTAWPFIQGAIFIGVVLLIPDGIVGGWRRLMGIWHGLRDRRRRRPPPPPAAALEAGVAA